MPLALSLLDRTFTPAPISPALALSVTSYSWHAIGGPKSATLSGVAGDEAVLWECVGWLRYGLTIKNDQGDPVWWGCVQRVAIEVGSFTFSACLDTMANRITVAYGRIVDGTETSTERATTVYSEDIDSVAEYGIKEALLTVSSATDAQAELFRDNALILGKLPQVDWEYTGTENLRVEIECCGWWDTLDWRLYQQGGDTIANTQHDTEIQLKPSPATWAIAQSFTTTGAFRLTTVQLLARKVGAPTTRLRMYLCADASDSPGSILATVDVQTVDLDTALDWVRWDFGAGVDLSANTRYWIQINAGGTGTFDTTNYVETAKSNGDAYAGGRLLSMQVTTWNSSTNELVFIASGLRPSSDLIALILTNQGQFLSEVYLEQASGIYTSAYADGDATALAFVEELLALGTTSAPRLLARVEPDRSVTIYPEPTNDVYALRMNARGQFSTRYDLPITPEQCPVGVWVSLSSGIPATANLSMLADPSSGFIEQNEYDVASNTLRPTMRGRRTVWDLGR